MLSSCCSVIEVRDCENVSLVGLRIEGNKEKNDFLPYEKGAAIFLEKCVSVSLESLEISGFNGAAISVKRSEHVSVQHCRLERCTQGLHLASRVAYANICNNEFRESSIFASTTYFSLFRENSVSFSKQHALELARKCFCNLIEANKFENCEQSAIAIKEKQKNSAPKNNKFSHNLIQDCVGCGFFVDSPTTSLSNNFPFLSFHKLSPIFLKGFISKKTSLWTPKGNKQQVFWWELLPSGLQSNVRMFSKENMNKEK